MTAELILLGTLTLTAYQPIPAQTDDSPTWTSIGDRTTRYGTAVSQDLLKSGQVHYGDILFITGYGYRVVNDCTNARLRRHVDMCVFTHDEEHAVGIRRARVYVVRHPRSEHN